MGFIQNFISYTMTPMSVVFMFLTVTVFVLTVCCLSTRHLWRPAHRVLLGGQGVYIIAQKYKQDFLRCKTWIPLASLWYLRDKRSNVIAPWGSDTVL